jgi:hypothetical protein
MRPARVSDPLSLDEALKVARNNRRRRLGANAAFHHIDRALNAPVSIAPTAADRWKESKIAHRRATVCGAFRHLRRRRDDVLVVFDYGVTPSGRAIYIRSVVRPQPDAQLLARMFWQMAMREAEMAKTFEAGEDNET